MRAPISPTEIIKTCPKCGRAAKIIDGKTYCAMSGWEACPMLQGDLLEHIIKEIRGPK